MVRLLTLFAVIWSIGCSDAAPPPTPIGVLSPDPNLLTGLWFDIKHLPHELQKDCRDTATLLRIDDTNPQEFEFIFECRQPDELWYNVTGKASPHPADPALIDFSFDNGFVDEAVSLRYWIFDADTESAQWIVVGYPSENWLWFLSKTGSLDSAIIEQAIDKLVAAGHYDRDLLEAQLIETEQSHVTK